MKTAGETYKSIRDELKKLERKEFRPTIRQWQEIYQTVFRSNGMEVCTDPENHTGGCSEAEIVIVLVEVS